jgi:GTP-binding protein
VERTRLLVHLIDTSDSNADDPVHSFEVINGELDAFSAALMEKPMIVVATKLDATTDTTRLEALRDFCKRRKLEFHSISAVAGDGVKDLVRSIADALDKIPRLAPDASLHSRSDEEQDVQTHAGAVNRSAVAANEEEDS